MKRSMGRLLAGVLAIQLAPGGAWAAGCASRTDAAALKVAALQQELMVAAFSCHDVARYNEFVLAHQPELIASDASLKAFFVRRDVRHGEAGYHTYKTELANAASLRSIHDDGFCDNAATEFDGSSDRGSLAAFVGVRNWPATSVYAVCPGVGSPDLQTASIAPDRWRTRRYERNSGGSVAATPRWDDSDFRDREDTSDDNPGYFAPRPHQSMDSER